MNLLHEWAMRWDIPYGALMELTDHMGLTRTISTGGADSEAGVAARVRCEYAEEGNALWRNNVGAYIDNRGVQVRYGLCNESKRINETVKSSDLIGITRLTIQPHMVGLTVGQFTAVETKAPGWTYTGTPREEAQARYIGIVNALGGRAYFTS